LCYNEDCFNTYDECYNLYGASCYEDCIKNENIFYTLNAYNFLSDFLGNNYYKLESYITTSTIFCSDMSFSFSVRKANNSPTLICENQARKPESILNLSIGLITADEAWMMGIPSTYDHYLNTMHYLNVGWTMTPFKAGLYEAFSAGIYDDYSYGEEGPPGYSVTPVINLTAETVRSLVWNFL